MWSMLLYFQHSQSLALVRVSRELLPEESGLEVEAALEVEDSHNRHGSRVTELTTDIIRMTDGVRRVAG